MDFDNEKLPPLYSNSNDKFIQELEVSLINEQGVTFVIATEFKKSNIILFTFIMFSFFEEDDDTVMFCPFIYSQNRQTMIFEHLDNCNYTNLVQNFKPSDISIDFSKN